MDLADGGQTLASPFTSSRDPHWFVQTHTVCALTSLYLSHPIPIHATGQDWPPDPRAFPRVPVSRYPSPGRLRALGDSRSIRDPSQSVFITLYLHLHTYPHTLFHITIHA
ncbi:hypothetical protein RSOLAG1IB_02087 [Rhizoctonia solani AG-1 IB]|uniref:Uncharacterized protein n=1 Tax=Thanatephorus cucumeris (strain AG1-IB / isolate 7/3/14) TaxID=1108050 RepID=A0A0B7FM99_THACB|nr:hypothetical protein RSOLAG1IB_02087 [Rhizoctonia solani AG-1 IB]